MFCLAVFSRASHPDRRACDRQSRKPHADQRMAAEVGGGEDVRVFCQDWLSVQGYDLDDFHAGRFDVNLLPDWVRKSCRVHQGPSGSLI